MARPSKYNNDVQAMADDYVSGGHVAQDDPVPTVAGLACLIGVTRETLYAWAQVKPGFSDTLKRLNAQQEKLLTAGGIRGDMNSTICKLMLANHGYSERQDVNHSSRDGSMSAPTRIEIVATTQRAIANDADGTD